MTSPEIEFIIAYNKYLDTWMADPTTPGLLDYITDETVLHEPVTIPWGGTLVGEAGWIHMREKAVELMTEGFSFAAGTRPDRYYQSENVVLRELSLVLAPTEFSNEPLEIPIVEKYTIADGRIAQIDEFYADTASFLAHLGRAEL